MSASCCNHHDDPHRGNEGYRRVLWAVLGINAAMFIVEVAAGLAAGSASLHADALDFLGDAGNYAISLFVVGMALRYRAMAAFLKGATMGVFGLWVLGITAWHVWQGTLPNAATMGAVGIAALVANAAPVRPAVGLPGRRCEHAFGVGLYAQRRAGQSRRAAGGRGGVRYRHRLARRDGSCNYGRSCLAGLMARSATISERTSRGYGSTRLIIGWRRSWSCHFVIAAITSEGAALPTVVTGFASICFLTR